MLALPLYVRDWGNGGDGVVSGWLCRKRRVETATVPSATARPDPRRQGWVESGHQFSTQRAAGSFRRRHDRGVI